ncbi:WD domain G-beta repeat protein [Paragonimus westermani]|uniref:WD domain G-beta repeat protein n=1 Tax=Paragonimus westermani TaxID=34504 RepID=A0A8T0DSU9_9TREM|nr:WD domain G-beta repeat protein [Paragonimus westermani]
MTSKLLTYNLFFPCFRIFDQVLISISSYREPFIRFLYSDMKLKRFLLRYFPPGIILEYEQGGDTKTKSLDLLELTSKSDTEEILAEICEKEPLVTEKRKFQVFELIEKLKSKLAHADKSKFGSYKVCFGLLIDGFNGQVLRAHILPLTNVAFDKSGKQ